MNKEYFGDREKTFVRTDEGVYFTTYYDNLDDVLVLENLVEEMEKKLKYSKEQYQRIIVDKKNHSKLSLSNIIKLIISGIIVGLVGGFLFSFMDMFFYTATTISELTNTLVLGTIVGGVSAFSLGMCLHICDYVWYKQDVRSELGYSTQIEYLTRELEESKKKLEELKKDKTCSKNINSKENNITLVNDKEKLKNLKRKLNLSYDFGYQKDKYYKYYETGALHEKLSSAYSEEDIHNIENYFKKEQPKVKSRVRTWKH